MRWLAVSALLLAGCEKTGGADPRVVECFSWCAYAVLSKSLDTPPVEKCCGSCGGTGLVRSGDRQEWVPCPCPDACECKQNKSSCKDGKCTTKKK